MLKKIYILRNKEMNKYTGARLFTAAWCEPCTTVKQKILSKPEYKEKTIFVDVNDESNASMVEEACITQIPTIVFYEEDAIVSQVVGNDPQKIEEMMNKNLQLGGNADILPSHAFTTIDF